MPKTEELFDSVVNNAMDFLRSSVAELETRPKYSVINFWTSIELLFKARLVLEHWTLIYSDTNQANPETLATGNFVSTSFDLTLVRLKNLTGLNVNRNAESSFKSLRNRRNQLVHFFHQDYQDKPSGEILATIVAEQCRGWFYIHRFLTHDWKVEFKDHLRSISEIHALLKKQHGFLEAKYESLRGAIEKGIENGEMFRTCSSCSFQALLIKPATGARFEFRCLVCEIQGAEFHVDCPKCGQKGIPIEWGEATCDECDEYIQIDKLRDIFDPPPSHHDDEQYAVACDACDEGGTVIPIDGGDREQWACFACGKLWNVNSIEDCPKCGTSVATDDHEELFLSGCPECYFFYR